MEVKLAKIVSVVFQPLLIPTYTLIIVFSLNSYVTLVITASARQLILGMVFATTFLFPALLLLFLYKRGIIKTLQMDAKEERIIPLFLTGIFYFLALTVIRKTGIDEIYYRLFFGSLISVILALMISLVWKISMHMLGMGGLVGALIGVSQTLQADLMLPVMLAVFFSGLTGFARLRLEAHTPLQVYAGFLTGMFLMLLVFRF